MGEEQLLKLQSLHSDVSILWSYYSYQAAKLEKWSQEEGGEEYLDDAKTARYLEKRFRSARDQLGVELDELIQMAFGEWSGQATELGAKLDKATKDVNKHYEELKGTASAVKTGAQVLAAILEVLKFLALIP